MNRKYAIEILEMVERKTLEATSNLAKESFRYLLGLKSTTENIDLYNRIYSAKYQIRHR